MKRLFLSYRRSDCQDVAGRIFDRLVAEFGRDAVFKDVDSIPLSVPFRQYIRDWLRGTNVVLVLIGPTWTTCCNEAGRRRLDNPGDFVRLEIETADALKVPLIPITVTNALMPTEVDLPESLRPLVHCNGQAIRPDPDFHHDMDRLLTRLNPLLGRVSANRTNKSIKRLMLGLAALLVVAGGVGLGAALFPSIANLGGNQKTNPTSERVAGTKNETSRTDSQGDTHKISTETTLTADPPISFGQFISFTAQVTSSEAKGPPPRGSVKFTEILSEGARELAIEPIQENGKAIVRPEGLMPGKHWIEAEFVPVGGRFKGSISTRIEIEVRQLMSRVELKLEPVVPHFGQPLILTAQVSIPTASKTVPRGSVTFSEVLAQDNRILATVRVNATGKAVAEPKGLTRGKHRIDARFFSMDTGIIISGQTVDFEVARGKTKTTVLIIFSDIIDGVPQSYTLEARVHPIGEEVGGRLSGVVRFSVNGQTRKLAPALKDGKARLVEVELNPGKNRILATFEPDEASDFDGSVSEAVVQEVK